MDEINESQIDLREYLRVVIKRRWTIIAAFVIVVLAVAVNDFTSTRIYEATIRMIIEKENPNVVSVQEVMAVDASGTDYYQTQYKIIESRTIARMVIERLKLDKSEEFNPRPSDNFIANFFRSIKEMFGSWKQAIKDLMTDKDKAAAAAEKDDSVDAGLVNSFISRINVKPIRNSRLVDIGFEAKDPVMAMKIANALAQAYIDNTLEVRLSAIKDAMNWINERISKERVRVEEAERRLQAYREQYSIVTEFSGEVETVTAQKLAKLNEQVVDAESRRVEAETKYRQALRLKDNPLVSESIPEVINNPLIQQMRKTEVELYSRISELSKKYGRQHPSMKSVESELEALKKRQSAEVLRIIDSLKNEYEVAGAREQSIKSAMNNQKHEALELNKKGIDYGVLKRESEGTREMYEVLIKRFKETSVTEDINSSNVRIIDRAEVPNNPVKPRIRRDLMLAVVVGLMLGLGLAFFLEYLDNTLKTPEEVENYLKTPYLGMVPVIISELDSSELDSSGEPVSGSITELVTMEKTKSTASESYRSVRTKILFSSAEAAPKSILVTSTTAKEGKTITSANLAVTMAQAGSRVVIVDCDMRRPRMHHLLGIKRSDQGISNVLVGSSKLQDVIVETAIPNLHFIQCGPIPPNPSELLGSQKMRSILETLGRDYDRIIIDTPPISAVTDAIILSRFVDGVVLVARAGAIAREIVRTAVENLASVNAHLLGVVLNAVDIDKGAYYYHYYYYQYGYYYGEGAEEKQRKRRSDKFSLDSLTTRWKKKRKKKKKEKEDSSIG